MPLLKTVQEQYPNIPWENVTDWHGEVMAISKLTPMKSAAGWYLGRYCTELEDGKPTFLEPLSRETEYFGSKEDLQAAINNKMLTVRNCEENNAMYAQGIVPFPGKGKPYE